MVAVLDINQTSEHPFENFIDQHLNTWVKVSWADDIGKKRLMYEDLGVKEYWVIDVKNVEILAFAITDLEGVKGSYRITRSQVITGLETALLQEVLRLSRENDHGYVTSWLLTQLQHK